MAIRNLPKSPRSNATGIRTDRRSVQRFRHRDLFHRPGRRRVRGSLNTLMQIGVRNFLDLVAPVEENTAGGRYLDRRSGDGGYMVICQGSDRETQQAVASARSMPCGSPTSPSARPGISELHPRPDASFLEIDWDMNDDFNGNWHPAGGLGWVGNVNQSVTQDFLGVELQGADPVEIAELWGKVTDLPVERDGAVLSIALNNATIRFVEATDGRGPGLGGLDLAVNDRERILKAARERGCYVSADRVDVCGVRWYLQDAG